MSDHNLHKHALFSDVQMQRFIVICYIRSLMTYDFYNDYAANLMFWDIFVFYLFIGLPQKEERRRCDGTLQKITCAARIFPFTFLRKGQRLTFGKDHS